MIVIAPAESTGRDRLGAWAHFADFTDLRDETTRTGI